MLNQERRYLRFVEHSRGVWMEDVTLLPNRFSLLGEDVGGPDGTDT